MRSTAKMESCFGNMDMANRRKSQMKRKIIGTLLFMFLAAAGVSAFSERDSFEGFQEFSFFMGDSMVSYYVDVDTIRIKNRSLGSRANRYDKELHFRKEYEHGVPFVYYTESETRFVENEDSPWGAIPVETRASDSVEKKAMFLKSDYFFLLIHEHGDFYYGVKDAYVSWEKHLGAMGARQSSFLVEGGKSYSCDDIGFDFPHHAVQWGKPWAEGANGKGIGEWISFLVPDSVTEAQLHGGLKGFISIGYVDYSRPDLYEKNSRPRIVSVYIDDVFYKDVLLEDTPDYQDITPGKFLTGAEEIKIVIKDVYAGRLYEDACINDIVVLPVAFYGQ